MTELLSYTEADGIATIAMDDGKANVLSPAMIEQLNKALDKAEAAKAVVLLTGRAGVFSGGFDLKVMQSGPQAAIDLTCSGSRLALRILQFKTPVIGAASGHAIAMGAFLLLACDYRIGLSGAFKTGLNETQIGMTMHHFGIEMARNFVAKTYLKRSLICGEIFAPQDAKAAGYYDQLAAPDDAMDAAIHAAHRLKSLNMHAFAGTKIKSRKTLFETLNWAIEQDEQMSVLA